MPDASVMTGVGLGSCFAPGTGKCIAAVFFSPTFMVWPHANAHSSVRRRWRCIFSGLGSGAPTSSANARWMISVPLLSMPRSCPFARRKLARELMKMVYRTGEWASPCPRPMAVGTGSVVAPFTCTLAVRFSSQDSKTPVRLSGSPWRRNTAVSAAGCTEGYALSKSTKAT